MPDVLRPAADWELQSIISGCIDKRSSIELIGRGSKRAVGRPVKADVTVSTASLRGIPLYEPSEMVMSARAGTMLSQVEADLAARGQMLPFEPIDLGPAIGAGANAQTVGAVFASNLSGARRISAGAARDHLLGVRGVNGRAEIFKSGGRVMKNVTGYDIARGLSGSWGTLAVLTEVTFKVVPIPETSATVFFTGLPEDIAVETMCAAVGTPFEVSGAVHLPATLASRLQSEEVAALGKPITALRIENFAKSVVYRSNALKEALKVYGKTMLLEHADSVRFWSELRRLSVLPASASTLLWRVSTAPRKAPSLVSAIKRHMSAEVLYDWAGGLLWLEVPATSDAAAADIRRAVALHGGHATLIRADETMRSEVEVFQPLEPGLDKLTRGLKHAFDPAGVLNPGRMYAHL